MKKITLFILASAFLLINAYSQWYEYTPSKYVNNFTGPTLDKINGSDTAFHWETENFYGGSLLQEGGILYINNVLKDYDKIILHFDSIPLNINGTPKIIIETKADTIFEPGFVLMLEDTEGASSFSQHQINMDTTWKVDVIDVGGSWADISKISSLTITGKNGEDYPEKRTVQVRYLSLGVASYTPPSSSTQFSLTKDVVGNGSITLTPDQTSYDSSSTVTLIAVADEGSNFTGWSGDISGSTNPINVTMDGNKSITANFSVSGIDNNALSSLVKCYPNPVTEILNISGLEANAAVVSDLTGKKVMEINEENIQKIDVAQLQSGVYVLTLDTPKGTLNKLFIVE